MPLLEECNKILHNMKQRTITKSEKNDLKEKLRKMQKRIDDNVAIAISRCSRHHAENISKMNSHAKTAWDSVDVLKHGLGAKSMAMKLPDGNFAKNNEDNMSVMGPHLHKVFNFNNHRPVHCTVLDLIKQLQ